MNMNAEKYLRYLQNEIHSIVFATVDENGDPATCVIDMMLADENGLYFLTAKGKTFYARLKAHDMISITGFHGEDTMSSKSVTVRGRVRELGGELLPKIFKANLYMAEIYPDEKSRAALTVFQVYEGEGEFFDLSAKPIFRESFSFGGAAKKVSGYFVTDKCIGCKLCYSVCPQKCIDITAKAVIIEQEHCLHCGRCAEICPAKAIEKRESHDTAGTN